MAGTEIARLDVLTLAEENFLIILEKLLKHNSIEELLNIDIEIPNNL